MKRLSSILAIALLGGALGIVPGEPARAGHVIRVSGGFTTHHDRGPAQRAPHYSHGVPFESRSRRSPRSRAEYSHGVPFLSREQHRPSSDARVLGRRDRHVLSAGCRPFSRRSYDRRGRLVIEHLTKCFDRYGRPYVLGDHRRHR